MRSRGSLLLSLLAAAGLALAVTVAWAQSYPSQPVRIIIPQSAGGLNDVAARLIQPHLERGLKQTVGLKTEPAAPASSAPTRSPRLHRTGTRCWWWRGR